MRLTRKMHDSVVNSPVGRFLDRLITEEYKRGGNTSIGGSGNVVQQLWDAFMAGADVRTTGSRFKGLTAWDDEDVK